MKKKNHLFKGLLASCLVATIIILQYRDATAQWTTSGTNIFNSNTGNVGIGTSSPSFKLDVNGSFRASGAAHFPGTVRSSSSTTAAQIVKFAATTSAEVGIQFNRPGVGFFDWKISNIGGNLIFKSDTSEFSGAGTERIRINFSTGNVSIGTTSTTHKLNVCGAIRATELRLETGWCDYVFDDNYYLRPISEVAEFIKTNKHLPDINPGHDVETNGLQVADMTAKMMRKIEELTLYIIQQDSRLTALEKENELLKNNLK